MATADKEKLASEPTCLLRGEEDDNVRDILRMPESPERDVSADELRVLG